VDRVLITDRGERVSEILVGAGSLTDGTQLLPPSERRRCVAVLAQEPAAGPAEQVTRALQEQGVEPHLRFVPDREAAKTMAVAEDCYRWLNGLAMTRFDTVIGVGGGAVCDLAGFVAGTYLRGVQAVLVPTTLLAAVDAAIGGKTAVNVDGKNLVGVFKHPERVLVDLDVLKALPDDLLREGSAEALKVGMIADPEIVDLYGRDGIAAPLHEIVLRAVNVKAEVVSEDYREMDRRAFLNYGHTVGHALETLSSLSHGEAVAVGMVAAAAASETVTGFSAAALQNDVIARLGLPVRAPDVDGARVREVMELDKKRDETGMRMVLLEDIGRPALRSVDAATVDAALEAIGLA
jgi:3-dehydroquinate synthase